MKKSIIIILAILVLLICWYFFVPIKWTFGLRPPKNLEECIKIGGSVVNDGQQKPISCYYKNLIFSPYVN